MQYTWAVIGAGPAGIGAIGKLIDQGVPAKKIAWIDPQFKVGDFGTVWRNVPSNTKVSLFLAFLQASDAFHYDKAPKHFELHQRDPEETCYLRLMADPLQWVTNHLKETVHSIQAKVETLALHDRLWHIKLTHSEIKANNVILAIGAEPKNLTYSLPIIPLDAAMDSTRISQHIQPDDTVAVFGSSHSAILALRNLVENKVKRIINFYRSPLCYAVYLNDGSILFDDTGLKGSTAEWARAHLDGKLPAHLVRVYSNEENIEHYLPQCNKVVYALGFGRRLQPIIENLGHVSYIEQCGIIAPGLFGLGIAFPEAKINTFGMVEYRVGLWKFMEYLQRVLPIWLKYPA